MFGQLRRGVLRAALTQVGTNVHPRTDGGVRLDIAPLIDIAGEEVRDLLEKLATEEELDVETRAAVVRALEVEKRDDS